MLAFAAPLLALATMAPLQELETVGGAPFSIQTVLARGPILLIFWNSWLPDSSASIPGVREAERAAQAHGWPGAIVIFQDDSNAAKLTLGDGVAALPRVLDRRGVLLRRFQVTRAPALLVIDRNGEVLSRSGLAVDEVREAVSSLAGRSTSFR